MARTNSMWAKTSLLALVVILSSGALAAEEAKPTSDKEWIRGFARHAAKDNPIPEELVKKIEEDYLKATTDPKLEQKKTVVRHVVNVVTELTQEKVRALKGPTRIMTPPGGGTIDLADYVLPLKGAFQMKVQLEDEHHQNQPVSKVYFISQSKQRQIADEKFGAGCGKYMEITSYFTKQMKKNGFDLYTADQRYVSVVRGTFILVSYLPEALQLASVTFLDSRYTKWDCPLPEVL